jgi:magnesium transporter
MNMTVLQTFYFSRFVGKKVYSDSGKVIGKVKDLIANFEGVRPKIIAIELKIDQSSQIIDFSNFKIEKFKKQYRLTCPELREFNLEGHDTMFIGKQIQDRQVVDIDGRKLVRVNDVRMAMISRGAFLIAVDVGLQGLLRRLGIAKPITALLKVFKTSIPNKFILWEDVETVGFGHAGIKLSKDYSNLSKLHPSDLADIMEELDRNTQIAIFASLDQEKAADVLEELRPNVQKAMLENMTLDKAADLLEMMPADEVADILEEFKEEQAEALLKEMESEASSEVRELMEYPENTVGSIMSTDYIFFNEDSTAGETIDELRRLKPESDIIYYLYILNESEKLVATVSLRDIIVAEPQTKLSEIMNKDVIYVYDDDKIDALNEIIAKYSLLAVPVVDENEVMNGVVVINDVVFNLLKARRKRI